MSIRRNIRRGKYTAAEALIVVTHPVAPKDASPKLVRWLKGRIAWDMGRKRTGQ